MPLAEAGTVLGGQYILWNAHICHVAEIVCKLFLMQNFTEMGNCLLSCGQTVIFNTAVVRRLQF